MRGSKTMLMAECQACIVLSIKNQLTKKHKFLTTLIGKEVSCNKNQQKQTFIKAACILKEVICANEGCSGLTESLTEKCCCFVALDELCCSCLITRLPMPVLLACCWPVLENTLNPQHDSVNAGVSAIFKKFLSGFAYLVTLVFILDNLLVIINIFRMNNSTNI